MKLITSESCIEYRFYGAGDEFGNCVRLAHELTGDLNHGMNAFYDWNLLLDERGGPNHIGNWCYAAFELPGHTAASYYNEDGSYRRITAGNSFAWVEDHPAFTEFFSFIQPWKDKVNQTVTPLQSMRFVCTLNHFNVDSILDGFNFVISAAEDGSLVYRDFYTEEAVCFWEKQLS